MTEEQRRRLDAAYQNRCKFDPVAVAIGRATDQIREDMLAMPDRDHYWSGDVEFQGWIANITVNRKPKDSL